MPCHWRELISQDKPSPRTSRAYVLIRGSFFPARMSLIRGWVTPDSRASSSCVMPLDSIAARIWSMRCEGCIITPRDVGRAGWGFSTERRSTRR